MECLLFRTIVYVILNWASLNVNAHVVIIYSINKYNTSTDNSIEHIHYNKI